MEKLSISAENNKEKSIKITSEKNKLTEEDLEKYSNLNKKINFVFKEYYRNLLPFNNHEMEVYFQILSQKLPVTFRINKI